MAEEREGEAWKKKGRKGRRMSSLFGLSTIQTEKERKRCRANNFERHLSLRYPVFLFFTSRFFLWRMSLDSLTQTTESSSSASSQPAKNSLWETLFAEETEEDGNEAADSDQVRVY